MFERIMTRNRMSTVLQKTFSLASRSDIESERSGLSAFEDPWLDFLDEADFFEFFLSCFLEVFDLLEVVFVFISDGLMM